VSRKAAGFPGSCRFPELLLPGSCLAPCLTQLCFLLQMGRETHVPLMSSTEGAFAAPQQGRVCLAGSAVLDGQLPPPARLPEPLLAIRRLSEKGHMGTAEGFPRPVGSTSCQRCAAPTVDKGIPACPTERFSWGRRWYRDVLFPEPPRAVALPTAG